jgi:hypothetical protein
MPTMRALLVLAALLLAGCPDVKPPKDPPRVPHPKAAGNPATSQPAPRPGPTPESSQGSRSGR